MELFEDNLSADSAVRPHVAVATYLTRWEVADSCYRRSAVPGIVAGRPPT